MNKPVVKLIGENGNIFNLVGIATKALKTAGLKDKADELTKRIFNSRSYDEALVIIGEYCEIE